MFVNEVAVRVVDRALSLSGGGRYLNRHLLARAYRALSAPAPSCTRSENRAYQLLGDVALGRRPLLH